MNAQTTCPITHTSSRPFVRLSKCISPKPSEEKMIDFRSEYLPRKTVKTMPLKATSSKMDGKEMRRLGEAGGKSPDRLKTCRTKLQVIGSPSESRYTNDAATCDSARMT